MKYNIEEKIQTLTTIENSTLKRLNKLVSACIVDAILECELSDDTQTTVDLGYGSLCVSIDNGSIRYKFVPNAKLEEDIVRAIKDKKVILDDIILDKLKSELVSTYKDLF